MRKIREQTRNGDEIAEYMLNLARDENTPPAMRFDAWSWLADHGFGEPAQTTYHGSADEPSTDQKLSQLSDEELEELARQHGVTPLRRKSAA